MSLLTSDLTNSKEPQPHSRRTRCAPSARTRPSWPWRPCHPCWQPSRKRLSRLPWAPGDTALGAPSPSPSLTCPPLSRTQQVWIMTSLITRLQARAHCHNAATGLPAPARCASPRVSTDPAKGGQLRVTNPRGCGCLFGGGPKALHSILRMPCRDPPYPCFRHAPAASIPLLPPYRRKLPISSSPPAHIWSMAELVLPLLLALCCTPWVL